MRLGALDRQIGETLRDAVADRPGLGRALSAAAQGLSPAFRGVVAVLILLPRDRRTGLAAGAAATGSALVAGRLRRIIGRSRPVGDDEPGFPSRHAAAAVAIVSTVRRGRPRLGALLGLAAAVGLMGRITSGRHDPADIASGAFLGMAGSAVVERVAGGDR